MSGDITRRGALSAALAASAAACAPSGPKPPPYKGEVRFLHGVASGDPLADRVIIWTRVSPDHEGPVPVRWAVARDQHMSRVVASGFVMTDSSRDYTVKIDVPKLKPGRTYYYAFLVDKARSTVGRTKTLPDKGIDKVIMAAVSCANYPAGFFNVYEALSKRNDVDVVLHLGDYIYEYGVGEYDAGGGVKIGRTAEPPVETISLADYRTRHAQYKTDPDLQAAHANAPFICVWDDHEVCDNDWVAGGENHNPEKGEGDFAVRKRNALQAYYEWIPIREPAPGNPLEACNRAFQFGDLATLIMLETRLLARSQQLDYGRDLTLLTTAWDTHAPDGPRPLAPGAPMNVNTRVLPKPFDMRSGQPAAVTDWKTASTMDPRKPPEGFAFIPDAAAFKAKLNDPSRALLGAAQEKWISDLLGQNQATRSPWAIFGNQVLMAKIAMPARNALTPVEQAALDKSWPMIARSMQLQALGLSPALDSWNGYPAQRARLMKIFEESDANIVVLTGDSHQSWASELMSSDGRTRLADELGVSSVTSPSFADGLPPDPDLDFARFIAAAKGEVKWSEPHKRGYTVLTLTRSNAKAEFFAVSDILSKDYSVDKIATFNIKPVKGPSVSALEKA